MFVDGRSVPDGTTIRTDVCIVGGGVAGITLACELRNLPFRVCVLESGGLEQDPGTQALHDGEWVNRPYPLVGSPGRLRFFGGTSNHWGGMSRFLDPIDFERREWVNDSGWPFGRETLDPYYVRAHDVVHLGPPSYEPDFWADPSRWNGAAKSFAFPLRSDVLITKLLQFRALRFGRVYRDALQRAGNVTVYLNTNITDIQTSRDARHVTRLASASLDGPRFFVSARLFVLASGGIENARLLLLSRRTRPAGLGNDHDLVGRFFMDHPVIYSGLVVLADPGILRREQWRSEFAPQGFWLRAVLGLSEECQRREQVLNYSCHLRDPGDEPGVASFRHIVRALRRGRQPSDLWEHVQTMIADLDSIGRAAYRKITGRRPVSPWAFNLQHQVEQAPNFDSRVTLSGERDALGQEKVRVDWRLSELDKRTVRRAQELMGQEFGREGVGRLRIDMEEADDGGWARAPSAAESRSQEEPIGSCHHMGTTRMHVNPRRGVVDAHCRVHGVSNLYIAGSSLFPTSGFCGPTLTVVALSLRLAERLRQVMA